MSRPAPNIVLTHFGRSGSTVLSSLLKQHSRIDWLEEYFSLKWIREPQTYNFTLTQLQQMIHAEAGRLRADDPARFVGYEIKLMNFLQNPSCNMVDYVATLADPAHDMHVVLRRRNTLKRICSVYKASQTRVYHLQGDTDGTGYGDSRATINFNALIDYDTGQQADTLPDLITRAQAREEQVLANYRRLGINYLDLFYEDDIEQDPTAAYARVLDHVGLPFEQATVALKKTGKGLRQDIANYDEMAAALQGSQHAWMLD